MFTLTIQHEFCAAHALVIAGRSEPVHGHNFKVTLTIEGAGSPAEQLDADGLLCDFHTAHAILTDVCEPLNNSDLNTVLAFNPTAELVAQHIADAVAEELDASLAPSARVASVTITEAPGCSATYTRPA